MTENEMATIVVDCCYKVHKALGPGLLESIYEAALAIEFDTRSIRYRRQQPMKAFYKGIELDVGFRADFIVEDKLIVELKSVQGIENIHHKVVLTYLRISGLKIGLLVNFNVELIKNGIHRKILGSLA